MIQAKPLGHWCFFHPDLAGTSINQQNIRLLFHSLLPAELFWCSVSSITEISGSYLYLVLFFSWLQYTGAKLWVLAVPAICWLYFHFTPRGGCVFMLLCWLYFHFTPRGGCVFILLCWLYFHFTLRVGCVLCIFHCWLDFHFTHKRWVCLHFVIMQKWKALNQASRPLTESLLKSKCYTTVIFISPELKAQVFSNRLLSAVCLSVFE